MRFVRRHLLTVYAILAFAYLLVPIGVVILFSFNDPAGRFNYTWQGFTLDHWRNWDGVPGLSDAMLLSIEIALVASLIATALGTLIALALVRYGFRGRGATNFLIFLPMATPEIVLGASLLTLFINLNVFLGFTTILIAHIMFCISYIVVTGESAADRVRPQPRGGGDGPRRQRVDDLPQGDPAADRPGDPGGRAAVVRTLGGRLRDHVLQLRVRDHVPALRLGSGPRWSPPAG